MSKGGMCKRPFGGNPSLNGLDDDIMIALSKGEITADRALSLRIIKMSVRDYLFFGLGKNGITPERFLEAYAYLYLSDPNKPGMSEVTKAKCFETHFMEASLGGRLSLDTFRRKLQQRREGILVKNQKQVFAYMDKYRAQEWRRLPKNRVARKGKHALPREHVIRTLVDPRDVKAFAGLYLYGRVVETQQPAINKKIHCTGTLIYKALLF